MEKFELINKLSDDEISIIRRSIESVTNENVDAILSAIVDTVNNLMPQDEKFGCPPAGDGTRNDGQPDRRCGDPNKPKASVKRKPKSKDNVDKLSKSTKDKIKKGSSKGGSPLESNEIEPMINYLKEKGFEPYKDGDIYKIRKEGIGIVADISPGVVIGKKPMLRTDGTPHPTIKQNVWDESKWSLTYGYGPKGRAALDEIFSAQEFGCPPAGDGTRKDGQPDRRCGDPNKPKASVKRKPKAESEPKSESKSEPKSESKSVANKVKEAKTVYKDQDGKSYDSLEELKKGSPGSAYVREMNVDLSPEETKNIVNKLQNPKTTTRDGKDYADYAINKEGNIIKNAVRRGDSWREDSEGLVIKGRGGEVISGYSPGRVIGRLSGNRLSGAYDTGKWGGTELQNEIDSILGNFSAQEFGCPPAGDGTRKDGQPDRRCGDPNKPKASVKRKPKAESKDKTSESKAEPKSEPAKTLKPISIAEYQNASKDLTKDDFVVDGDDILRIQVGDRELAVPKEPILLTDRDEADFINSLKQNEKERIYNEMRKGKEFIARDVEDNDGQRYNIDFETQPAFGNSRSGEEVQSYYIRRYY